MIRVVHIWPKVVLIRPDKSKYKWCGYSQNELSRRRRGEVSAVSTDQPTGPTDGNGNGNGNGIHDTHGDYRIVSLCPSNTELVCALGLSGFLVGIDNYSDYPPDVVRGLPRLGPDLHIDVEAVTKLSPHLVISSLSVPGMEKVVDAVAAAGLPQVVLSPHSFEDIYADLRTLADEVPEDVLPTDAASELINTLRQRVDAVGEWTRTHVKPEERAKLYWEWWPNPVFSPGQGNWLTELSALAGAHNIFSDLAGDSIQDDGTLVAKRDPDWFLAAWTGIPQSKVPMTKILARPEPWQSTTAYREQSIVILSEGLYCRPSHRLVDGLEQLVGLLYPQSVADLGLRQPEEYAPIRRVPESQ